MTENTELIPCIGCGSLIPASQDAVDPKHNASAGCLALFQEVSGRHFSDLRYGSIIDYTIDAYSLQHPGTESPRTIKSNTVHLISLYLQLEKGIDRLSAAHAKQQAATHHHEKFTWLEPPSPMGNITIVDIHNEEDPITHIAVVKAWANEVWQSFPPYHKTIIEWAGLLNI